MVFCGTSDGIDIGNYCIAVNPSIQFANSPSVPEIGGTEEMVDARRRQNCDLLKIFCKIYPFTFFQWAKPKRPLKVGIFEDLIEAHPTLSKTRLKRLLRDYTSTYRYVRLVSQKVPRVDLSGSFAGNVTDYEQEQAIKDLAKRAGTSLLQEAAE